MRVSYSLRASGPAEPAFDINATRRGQDLLDDFIENVLGPTYQPTFEQEERNFNEFQKLDRGPSFTVDPNELDLREYRRPGPSYPGEDLDRDRFLRTDPRSPLAQIAPKGQRALESWLLEMYGPIRGVNPGEEQLRRDIMEQEIRDRDNPLFRQAQVTPGAFMNTVRPSELPYVKTPYDLELERRLFERSVPTMPTEDLRLLDFGTV